MPFCITNGTVFISSSNVIGTTADLDKIREFKTETSARNYLICTIGKKSKKFFGAKTPMVLSVDEVRTQADYATNSERFSNENFNSDPLEEAEGTSSVLNSDRIYFDDHITFFDNEIYPDLVPSVSTGHLPKNKEPPGGAPPDVYGEIKQKLSQMRATLLAQLSYYDLMLSDFYHLFGASKLPAHLRSQLDKNFDEKLRIRKEVKRQLYIVSQLTKLGEELETFEFGEYKPRILIEEFSIYAQYMK